VDGPDRYPARMRFVATPWIEPASPTRGERRMAAVVRAVVRVPELRRTLLSPVVARPGYWFATGCAYVWGRVLRGRWRVTATTGGRLHWFRGLPRWAFGRGGTTIGAVYLTRDGDGPSVLAHEHVHTTQWRRYGLAFIPLYIAAGSLATTNRFEVEAGLEAGGYVS
jgi:hypothetical protein